jgi:hypothetical protein
MKAFRLGFFSLLLILAAALSGCDRIKQAVGVSSANSTSQRQPIATAVVTAVDSETANATIEITLPVANYGPTKVFRGTLGIYDQGTFDFGPGVFPGSSEILYVASLDKSAETLIAIHYKGGNQERTGYAYVFKREDGASPYQLAWEAPGMTSQLASDIDTYMQDHKVGYHAALAALQFKSLKLKKSKRETRTDLASLK